MDEAILMLYFHKLKLLNLFFKVNKLSKIALTTAMLLCCFSRLHGDCWTCSGNTNIYDCNGWVCSVTAGCDFQ